MPDTGLRPWTRTQERLASPVIRLMTLLNVWAYRLSVGRLGGTFLRGAPVCLVPAKGRRSSEPRTVALLYLSAGDDRVVVASMRGLSLHPAWYHNMTAIPDRVLQVRSTTRRM